MIAVFDKKIKIKNNFQLYVWCKEKPDIQYVLRLRNN